MPSFECVLDHHEIKFTLLIEIYLSLLTLYVHGCLW